jgi:hypothetical protein
MAAAGSVRVQGRHGAGSTRIARVEGRMSAQGVCETRLKAGASITGCAGLRLRLSLAGLAPTPRVTASAGKAFAWFASDRTLERASGSGELNASRTRAELY